MNPADIIEEETQPAVVVETVVNNSASPNVKDILDEEVVKDEVIENVKVDDDDFVVDKFDDNPAEPVVEKVKEKIVEPVVEKAKDIHVPNVEKNTVVARLFKPEIVMKTWNIIGGRVGKMVNSKNPDCLKFDAEDTEDIGILLKETAKEEDWSAFPTKWILLFVVGLIIVGKIIMWNKPQQQRQVAESVNKAPGEIPAQYEKLIAQMSDTINEVKEQNKLLRSLLDKKVEREPIVHHIPVQKPVPKQNYKGYDFEKISFSENGALINPEMAGQQGYTPEGKKVGFVSNEIKDVHEKWKLYQEHKENMVAA